MIKSPEQLKGSIRNLAKKNNLRAQEILQMFFFERLLERLANSKYCDRFILKGGLLISSLIGISERTTLDMDTTVRRIPMEENEIVRIINEILCIKVDDDIIFSFRSLEPIHDKDEYNNFRVHVNANYGKINCPMKIDITTGDIITPCAVIYNYPSLFDKKTAEIYSYPIETILAEKYETILRRNISTTRIRDYYDLHMLFNKYRDDIDIKILKEAVINTATQRESLCYLADWDSIIEVIKDDDYLRKLWDIYINENVYVGKLKFDEVLKTIEKLANILLITKK